MEEPANGTVEFVNGLPYPSGGGTEYVPNSGFTGTDYFSVMYNQLESGNSIVVNFQMDVAECQGPNPPKNILPLLGWSMIL